MNSYYNTFFIKTQIGFVFGFWLFVVGYLENFVFFTKLQNSNSKNYFIKICSSSAITFALEPFFSLPSKIASAILSSILL